MHINMQQSFSTANLELIFAQGSQFFLKLYIPVEELMSG